MWMGSRSWSTHDVIKDRCFAVQEHVEVMKGSMVHGQQDTQNMMHELWTRYVGRSLIMSEP